MSNAIPEALQHLHGLIALGLAERHGFSGKLALEVATSCIEALQRAHGGDRLGSRGVYIPAIDERQSRREKIRELMGPAPHSRKRARQVAMQLHVSEITVWRAVREKETA
jgi:hypothetical protein